MTDAQTVPTTWAKTLLRQAQLGRKLGRVPSFDSPLVKLAEAANTAAREAISQEGRLYEELCRAVRLSPCR
jgi:hypothetical protein